MQPLVPGDPKRIGDFMLLGRLGVGGMGRVYLGREPSGRKVAVKVVHAALLDEDPSFRDRFRHEVEAARKVGGFWTPAIVDWNADAEQPWYASAYINAPTLHDVVRTGGPLDLGRVAALGAGLAAALAAVHRAGLVHRDLKPSNVLMADDGPRVIDFGIVRVLEGATRLTRTGVRLLSLGYAPPEQMHGAKVTEASDVFALGAVLVFAATRHVPFPGETEAAVDRRMDQPPDLVGVPVLLRSVLRRCLTREPDARPTVTELLRTFASLGDSARPAAGAAGSATPRPTLVDPDRPEQPAQPKRPGPGAAVPHNRHAASPDAGRPPAAASTSAAPDLAPGGQERSPGSDAPARDEPPVESTDSEESTSSTPPGRVGPVAWLAGALTAGEVHWLAGLSWWWAGPIGAGVVLGVAVLLDVGRESGDDDPGYGILILLWLLIGMISGVLAHGRTDLPWWGVGLVGIGATVGAFVLTAGGAVWALGSRVGPVATAASVALGSGVILAALLLWAVGTAVWLAATLGAVAVLFLAPIFSGLASEPRPPR